MFGLTNSEKSLTVPTKEGKKKPVINKALRYFLFSGIKRRPEIKLAEKHMGEIASITIIVTEKKTKMVVHAVKKEGKPEQEPLEVPFNEEEKQKMLTTFDVKPQTIEESKFIFLMLDMVNKQIHIEQNFKDGREPKKITI